jgi:hypothetical protein
MTEEEREKLIKETRLAALNDTQRALAKLMDDRMNDPDDPVRYTAKIILHYLGQITTEVVEDRAGRFRL